MTKAHKTLQEQTILHTLVLHQQDILSYISTVTEEDFIEYLEYLPYPDIGYDIDVERVRNIAKQIHNAHVYRDMFIYVNQPPIHFLKDLVKLLYGLPIVQFYSKLKYGEEYISQWKGEIKADRIYIANSFMRNDLLKHLNRLCVSDIPLLNEAELQNLADSTDKRRIWECFSLTQYEHDMLKDVLGFSITHDIVHVYDNSKYYVLQPLNPLDLNVSHKTDKNLNSRLFEALWNSTTTTTIEDIIQVFTKLYCGIEFDDPEIIDLYALKNSEYSEFVRYLHVYMIYYTREIVNWYYIWDQLLTAVEFKYNTSYYDSTTYGIKSLKELNTFKNRIQNLCNLFATQLYIASPYITIYDAESYIKSINTIVNYIANNNVHTFRHTPISSGMYMSKVKEVLKSKIKVKAMDVFPKKLAEMVHDSSILTQKVDNAVCSRSYALNSFIDKTVRSNLNIIYKNRNCLDLEHFVNLNKRLHEF